MNYLYLYIIFITVICFFEYPAFCYSRMYKNIARLFAQGRVKAGVELFEKNKPFLEKKEQKLLQGKLYFITGDIEGLKSLKDSEYYENLNSAI